MKNIRNIIVPTDFSATARNAFHFAQHLAETLDAAVTVIHVNEYILAGEESLLTPISDLEINRIVTESMDVFVTEEDTSEDHVMVQTRVKTEILKGDLVERLVERSQANNTDLMVIGTTGKNGFLSKIIGSTAFSVANQAHCPVILVPHEAGWHPLQRIMYASNYDSSKTTMIQEVTDLARTLDATIHFVHIKDFDSDDDNEPADIKWDTLFPSKEANQVFEVATIFGDNKIEELKNYAVLHKIDLMVFVNQNRSYWQNLMHRSITENVALSIDIPVMVIHLDDHNRLSKGIF